MTAVIQKAEATAREMLASAPSPVPLITDFFHIQTQNAVARRLKINSGISILRIPKTNQKCY
jgi:hypothetical protein